MKNSFLAILILFALQSCNPKNTPQSIKNTKWVLTEWPNQMMPNTTKKATLNLGTAYTVTGKSFCNGFGGAVKIDGNPIKFGEFIGTMIFCDDVGQAEGKYTEGLRSTNSFKVIGNKLQLLNGDKLLMIFRKTE